MESIPLHESESHSNGFTVEQRDMDIQETIDSLSKKFLGVGFKNDGPTAVKIFEKIADKYKVYPDMVISDSNESDTEEVKKETSRAADFLNMYTIEVIEEALSRHFESK